MRSKKAGRKSRRKSKRKMRGGNYAGGNHIFSCVGSRKIPKTGCGHMQHGGIARLKVLEGEGVLKSPLLTYDHVPINLNDPHVTTRTLDRFPKQFQPKLKGGKSPGRRGQMGLVGVNHRSVSSSEIAGRHQHNHPYLSVGSGLQGGRRKSKRFRKKKSRRKSSKRRTRRHQKGGKDFIDGLSRSQKENILNGSNIANTNGYSVGVTSLIPGKGWLASTPAPIQAYNNCSQKVLK